MFHHLSFLQKMIAVTLLLCCTFSCAVNPVTGKKQLILLSEDQEKAMGLQSDPEVIASFGAYNDEKLQNFINEKGKQMAAISHRPNLGYQFRVLDSPVVNAFAVPGGFVYFTRGIMAHFNNEAEFAGVLGHEIGHITARHSAQQYSNQMLAQLGLIAGMVISPEFAQFGELASQGLGLLFLKFSRDHESQSDELGVEYSSKVGYDAHQMADFFNTIDRLSGGNNGGIPDFLSTHPNPANRYKRVHELAKQWQQTSNVSATNLKVNRDGYLRMIDGIVYGEDPRQGYVENNLFYHPELKFQFPVPQGWQFQNMASQVQMASKDGKAMIVMMLANEKSLNEAASASIQQNQLQLRDSRNITVNGLPAIAMLAEQQNQQDGSVLRALIYLIQYNNLIYKFYGLSGANDFTAASPLFENTMANFRALTDQSKINVKPERIKIQTVKSDGSLEQALRSFNMNQNRLEELSVLNGMKLTDPVTKGMLIKTVTK
ncbi:MAG: M48 family metalloprotease [Saprospiraceae bacterium]